MAHNPRVFCYITSCRSYHKPKDFIPGDIGECLRGHIGVARITPPDKPHCLNYVPSIKSGKGVK